MQGLRILAMRMKDRHQAMDLGPQKMAFCQPITVIREPTTILGIDPGLAVTGFGVIEANENALHLIDYGIIKTMKDSSSLFGRDLDRRLKEISGGIRELLLKHYPASIGIEEFLFYSKDISSSIKLGNVLGMFKGIFTNCGIEYQEYSAQAVKQAVTGYRNATKVQVQRMVKIILGMEKVPWPEHAADALAVAICHANTRKMRLITG